MRSQTVARARRFRTALMSAGSAATFAPTAYEGAHAPVADAQPAEVGKIDRTPVAGLPRLITVLMQQLEAVLGRVSGVGDSDSNGDG